MGDPSGSEDEGSLQGELDGQCAAPEPDAAPDSDAERLSPLLTQPPNGVKHLQILRRWLRISK